MKIKRIHASHKLVLGLTTYGVKVDEDYGSIRLPLMFIDENGKTRYCGYCNYPSLRDLQLYAQWDAKPSHREGRTYAWEARYTDCFVVDLECARRMARWLASIERAVDNCTVSPETFGKWCEIVATGMGLDGIVAGGGCGTLRPLSEIAGIIDNAIAQAQKKREGVTA